MSVEPGVIIDGALPRTPYERCDRLFDFLIHATSEAGNSGPHQSSEPSWIVKNLSYPRDAPYWTEYEDELIDKINEQLPGDLMCGLVADDPGTVIVEARDPGEEG